MDLSEGEYSVLQENIPLYPVPVILTLTVVQCYVHLLFISLDARCFPVQFLKWGFSENDCGFG